MYRTLIVDDIAVFRETFKKALSERFPSMIIDEAVNAKEAHEKVKLLRPELIFMDIRMPDESGIELTAEIKSNYPEIKIIILTDYDLPEYREAAEQAGADDFIPKGAIKISEIEKLLQRHMVT
ncbi:MAG: response regulator transcription factor [Desulfobacterales bacterium]|nr:response regulator transcription factor [Desulfobacteraceae bacterium]MBT4362877.1 response regulator transcription factor [Desulfobacteraceae bacterium]MBT7085920.1 response regulator transcription factor [Desulfobacterales bacterium]MBT7696886.1 response regulator transcription factor [Desulfobacterales bacterium]